MTQLIAMGFGLVLTLVGACAQTLGVLTFFFFDGLAPRRWPLIVGGTMLIAIGQLVIKFLVAKPNDTDR